MGNDHTHYDIKFENKDIEDLKKLLRITEKWIEQEIVARAYIEEMNG